MREIGGPTPSPGRPTAAPLTAGTPLSMEKGARTETASGRRSSIRWQAAPATTEGKTERLSRTTETGLETEPEDDLFFSSQEAFETGFGSPMAERGDAPEGARCEKA